MKKALIHAAAFCTRFGLSLFAAWIVSGPLIRSATRERGYAGAVGGEWLVIVGAFFLTYYLASKHIRPP